MKKKTKKNNKKKTVKIGKYDIALGHFIETVIACILLITIILSPKRALIVTQRYNSGTPEQNNSVKVALGEENTEQKYKRYFWWYNVLHEIGHGVMKYNSNQKMNDAEAEQLVNNFAYAYWDYYGNQEELAEVEEIINYAYDHIQNEEGRKMDYMEYAKKNWNKNSFYTFDKYGYFQFSCMKETFKNKKDLETVLKEMGVKNAKLTNQRTLKYETIDKETVDQIIKDAVDNIHEWGLEFPPVIHKYTNNPYYSYFKPMKRVLYPLEKLFNWDLSD